MSLHASALGIHIPGWLPTPKQGRPRSRMALHARRMGSHSTLWMPTTSYGRPHTTYGHPRPRLLGRPNVTATSRVLGHHILRWNPTRPYGRPKVIGLGAHEAATEPCGRSRRVTGRPRTNVGVQDWRLLGIHPTSHQRPRKALGDHNRSVEPHANIRGRPGTCVESHAFRWPTTRRRGCSRNLP